MSVRKGRQRNCINSHSGISKVGKQVTTDDKAEGRNNFFCLSLQWQFLFAHLLSGWTAGLRRLGLGEQSASDHLRSLNICVSMGPNDIHLTVLRE